MSLRLKAFGSYRAGGRPVTVTGEPVRRIAFTDITHYDVDPNGTFLTESAYVQYFTPADRNAEPPAVLLHGGGMTGAMWETTPDGRPGWLHGLLDAGFEVHVVDNVERGRAGWMPGLWAGAPLLRSMEEAWTLFRFGPPDGFADRRAFDGQQFPVDCLDEVAKGFVPRWTSTTDAQVAALRAVLERVGQAILVCHSQGGEVAFRAAAGAPDRVAAILAVEPSGAMDAVADLATIPVTVVHGDYLDTAPIWRDLAARWTTMAQRLRDRGGRAAIVDLTRIAAGASHMPMMDRASDRYLDAIIADRCR
ncbi:MAG: alpha/beta fold hydrolase [Inquilinaceae bacterium]